MEEASPMSESCVLAPRRALLLALLAFAIFCCFVLSVRGGFVHWDDNFYVRDGPGNKDGSFNGFLAAFRVNHHGNYYPLTLTTFWFEYRVWGLFPAGYRAASVVLHIINALLVCRLLTMLTGRFLFAWLIALVFAIHPLRVEAVAWISGRKELLYSMFYLLAMIAHVMWIRTKSRRSYALALAAFLCSLLSKGTAMTLPVVLLLLDYQQRRSWSASLIIEKLPHFALAFGFAALAVVMQRNAGAMDSGLPDLSIFHRLCVASYATLFYFKMTFLPTNLAILYLYPLNRDFEFPPAFSMLPFLVAPLVLGGAWLLRRSREAIFGMVFFFVALGPVLQLVPVGVAFAADRYTYLPSVGLLLMLFCIGDSLHDRISPRPIRVLVFLPILIAVIVFPVLDWRRVKTWDNTIDLMTDQLRQYPTSAFAWNNRGVAHMDEGRYREALADYKQAIALIPDYEEANDNIRRLRTVYRAAEGAQDTVPP